MSKTVAIVGATGAVGMEFVDCLESRKFPVGKLKLLASARSAGKTQKFKGQDLVVEELNEKSFDAGTGGAKFTTTGPPVPAAPAWMWLAVTPLGRLKTSTL